MLQRFRTLVDDVIEVTKVSAVGTTIGEVRRALARSGSDVQEGPNSSPSRLSNRPPEPVDRAGEEWKNGPVADVAGIAGKGTYEASFQQDEDKKLLKEFLDLTPFTLPTRMSPAVDPSPSVVHVRKVTSRKYKDSDSEDSDEGLSRHSGASRGDTESASATRTDVGRSTPPTTVLSHGESLVSDRSPIHSSSPHSSSPDFRIDNGITRSSPIFAKMTTTRAGSPKHADMDNLKLDCLRDSSVSIPNELSQFDMCDSGVTVQPRTGVSASPANGLRSSKGAHVDGEEENERSLNGTASNSMSSVAITLTTAAAVAAFSDKPAVATVGVDADAADEECTDDIGELFASYGAGKVQPSHSNLNQLAPISGSKESMVSCYSDAGEEHYGKFPVSGEILFGLSYNYKLSVLEIDIRQCKDLAAVDQKKNHSDPYIKTYLLPDRTKNGKRKSKIKRHTTSPVFDEIIKYHVTKSELETRTLSVMVWNSDRFGRNDFLGEVTIPLGYYSFENQTPSWHKLKDRTPTSLSMLTYKGEISLCLKFVTAEHISGKKRGVDDTGELHVLVKEARNLTAVRSNGTSDPFCKVNLLPDKSRRSQLKSPVIKRNCSPHWNHTFVFNAVSWNELRERSLELTIWDHDRLTSNDFLGGIRLNLGSGKSEGTSVDWMDSSTEEVHLWQAMLDRPNCWIDSTLLLRINMNQRK